MNKISVPPPSEGQTHWSIPGVGDFDLAGRRLSGDPSEAFIQKAEARFDRIRLIMLQQTIKARKYATHVEEVGEACTEDCEGCNDPVGQLVKRLESEYERGYSSGHHEATERYTRQAAIVARYAATMIMERVAASLDDGTVIHDFDQTRLDVEQLIWNGEIFG